MAPQGKVFNKGQKCWAGRGEGVKAEERPWSTQIREEGGGGEVLQALAGAGIPLRETTGTHVRMERPRSQSGAESGGG